MFNIFKIFAIIFMCFILNWDDAYGGHSFTITKQGNLEGEPSNIIFDKCRSQKCSTFYWSDRLETFFPSPSSGMYYRVVINLADFSSSSFGNLRSFLKTLANEQKINQFTPSLLLRNGTSYKFNQIFLGVKEFYEKVPHAHVTYEHAGIQEPQAARQKLSSLGFLREQMDSPSSVEKVEKLRHTLQDLRLEDEEDTESVSSLLEEQDENPPLSSKSPPSLFSIVRTEKAPNMLQAAVLYDELQEEIHSLRSKWESLKGGDWPPLGIKKSSQVKHFHGKDVEDFLKREEEASSCIILEISGLFGGESQNIPPLLSQKSSIRCLSIQDSRCMASDFEQFVKNEGEEINLLGEDKIWFVDVRTAFNVEGESLKDYLTRIKQVPLLDYFIQFNRAEANSAAFSSLNASSQRTHHLFWILLEYLDLLKDES